jgi:hypothetical protein
MTAHELAHASKAANPELRFAYHEDSAVGVFNSALNRFQMCYSRALGVQGWIYTGDQEILINGNPPIPAEEWSEI